MVKGPLSGEQMLAVLDQAPVAVYVASVENWELLYGNRLAQEWFLKKKEEQGITCYQAAGYDQPCPFCQAGKMNRSDFLVRDFRRPISGRVYQLHGKIIDWDGRPAHIEYILDITDKKREEEQTNAFKQELQEIFSNIPCGLCVYQVDEGKISPLFHNPAFYEIMGYSQEHIGQVEQETEYLGVHPEDVDVLRERVCKTILGGGVLRHTYRVWNDTKGQYRWIQVEGAVKSQQEGKKLIYCVYSDVSEQKRLEKELTDANEKMEDIINAIPGGVAIYKVSDIFETVYFSDGVPALSGYSIEEYRELVKRDAAEMTYPDDTAMVVGRLRNALQNHSVAEFEFRKLHRDGHVVWVHIQAKQIGEQDGFPLLHCVFHNISALKETQLELNHLINSIPGGIASYQIEGKQFLPLFFSDGVAALTGHTREEYEQAAPHGMDMIYDLDRNRVLKAARTALITGDVLDISYRMYHKDGSVVWVHVNGRRMGPLAESARFYAVFTGMSAETRLFQSIADEMADGIYVIDRKNYDLLYANESKTLFAKSQNCLGQKCYRALHGKDAPCEFCTLVSHPPDGEEHEMTVGGTTHFYNTRFLETEWNGIPAYVKYVRDVTDEVNTRREKERLAMYFQTVVKNLPGGISVIRCEPDGSMTPEFISDGFAAMCRMTVAELEKLYENDAFAGFHPDDIRDVRQQLQESIDKGEGHCELSGRIRQGDGGFLWVKSTLSMLQSADGGRRLYSVYTDISKAVKEKEQLRRQYENLILQHYRMPGPDALIIGHCNVTQNMILEIIDHTDSDLLHRFSGNREEFFTGLSQLVVEEEERRLFLDKYLNAPAMEAFQRNDTEQILDCFIKLPKEEHGRYVQFKVNLVETPDTGDITGILTVTDTTERTVSDRILHQLSVASYDLVVDVDLLRDRYTTLTCDRNAEDAPPKPQGSHSEQMAYMLHRQVVPKDQKTVSEMLDANYIYERFKKENAYSFSYSIVGEKGDILTKNLTVSAIDLRLGRICLARTDITNSVREQQGLLNMIAYTFEMAGFIQVNSERFTMYTRQTVLENLSPYVMEHYSDVVPSFTEHYGAEEGREEACSQFQLKTILRRLAEKPAGYDFVFPYREEKQVRYKQINVLWGDENHRTVCMVRADVIDMLAAERQSQKALEKALALAEEANQAKSDFLSTMSHDIRTPMNAIMGMTALAVAHLDDQERVADYLQKISVSSKHLLSLINDILDMSKIERSKITLNRMRISLLELVEQLSAIMTPQARAAGVQLDLRTGSIHHQYFYGDLLRINQILLNLLSNAVKFTPEGGSAWFLAEEIPPVKNPRQVRFRFTVSDTGIGMTEEFLAHLFAPFTRSREAARVEGTGLGLSITKGLVDLMEGDICVESKLNKGSTFRVELECERAPEEELAETGRPELSGAAEETLFAGRCFLVAEDNVINAEILVELLAMFGAKAVVKMNGAQAVRAFRDAHVGAYDAILMDIQMPEMNGYEATRAIRSLQRPDAQTIPIVAMTANAFAEDVQLSLEAGMDAHVAKPIDIDVLRTTLGKILNKK